MVDNGLWVLLLWKGWDVLTMAFGMDGLLARTDRRLDGDNSNRDSDVMTL